MVEAVLSITATTLAVVYPASRLLVKRDRSWSDIALFFALLSSGATELSDFLTKLSGDILFWRTVGLVAESFLPVTWLLFSLAYARHFDVRATSLTQRVLLVLSCLFPVATLFSLGNAFFYSPDFGSEQVLFLKYPALFFYIGVMSFLVIALIQLEATLANATHGSRWKIKLGILGVGCLLATHIFYYSQGVLYRTIDMALTPVRSVGMVVAILLLAYSHVRRGEGTRIVISREIAYKSTVLFIVSAYLLGLGLMGEGMRHFGASFSRSLLIALGFVLGVGLLIFLLSETVKRKIKVLLHRHFYENKYDYRVQWMEFTQRLTSAHSKTDLCQAVMAGFCDTFGFGCASLFLKDRNRGAYLPVEWLEMKPGVTAFRADCPLISVMAERKWIINLRDQRQATSEDVETFFMKNRVLFLVPLFLHDSVDGFIVLGKPLSSTEVYTYEDYDLMKSMAFQSSSALLNLRLGDQLAQARDMEAMGKVSAFVLHDLKNLVYTLSLVLDNAKLYMGDPEFQNDMIQSLGNTVTKMKILISQLKNLPGRKMLKKETVDLRLLALEIASILTEPDIPVKGEAVAAVVDRDEIHKVLLNLVLNGVDATSGKGPVSIEVGENGQPFIRVVDEGSGITEEFIRDGLFTPFRTTKKKGLGIGLYQCKQITEAHGGWIEVTSAVGQGTVFTVWLPSEEPDIHGADSVNRAA